MADGGMNEVRVFGPPGTGKTTWMAGAVRATARSRATSRLIVGSFTKTAASEIAGRGLPIARDQVGTLHALAYRAIGRPPVADNEQIADWNKTHPHLALSSGALSVEESVEVQRGATDGDVLASAADNYRARMLPFDAWPSTAVKRFFIEWQEWKRDKEVIDYTDMIDLALMSTEEAPGAPIVGFFDEVQDFTPLELALVRHWGQRMDRLVLAGDDDQCIYSFKGATPDAFLDPPIDDEFKRVLRQSYRVPHQVHAVAQAWVETLTRREPKDYEPRDEEGLVREAELRYQFPDPVVADVARQVADGRTVMLLGSCSYMLDPVKHALRDAGVPFHNPYRRRRGDWNPLRPSRGTGAAEKLACYLVLDERLYGELSRPWSGADVKKWSAAIRKQGVFRRGAVRAIAGLPDRELTYEEVASLFDDEEQLAQAVEPSMEWFQRNLLAGHRGTMEYPIKVARRDPMALIDEPSVVIGTIHSVKGGQADVVYLFPDLSYAGAREWEEGGEARDSVIRLMYVGMTRAREELVVCQPSSPTAVDPRLLTMGMRR